MGLHKLLQQFQEQDYLIIKNNAAQILINRAGTVDHVSVSRAWVEATVDRMQYIADKELNKQLQEIYKATEGS